MKLAIMQPYFMPYIGYFQLLNAADIFVIFDNVQFIKYGWIQRNRIVVNSQIKMFSLPIKKGPYEANINEKSLSFSEWNRERRKLLIQLEHSYGKAPYFQNIFPFISNCILHDEQDLTKFICHSLEQIKSYLGIKTKLLIASDLDVDHSLEKQERILSICELLNANKYINSIGGQELYDFESFAGKGIKLQFLKSKPITYSQFTNEFIANLSIIDVMMFNDVPAIQKMLGHYDYIEEANKPVKIPSYHERI